MKERAPILTRLNLVFAAIALLAATEILKAQDLPPVTDPGIDQTPVDTTGSMGGGANNAASGNILQERTTIIYRDAPLMDVINHLTEATKINAAITPAAEALGKFNVNIRLTDVTYEIALKTVLDLFRLGTVLENGVLRIDTLDNIKREQQEKKQLRDERMKLEPTRLMVWQLNHAKAADTKSVLEQTLQSIKAVDSRFSIQADSRSNKLLVEGTQDAQTRVKTLLENLDKGKTGVTIEARIIEAKNDVSQALRVNWGARFGMDAARGLSTGLPFPNSVLGSIGGAGATAPVGAGRNLPAASSFGLSLGSINGMLSLDTILQAYERENLANIIASPSMTVMDNEKAHFEETLTTAVLSMPIVNGQAVQGKEFTSKLSLDVTPLIASDNTLELDVEVNRDTPTSKDASAQVQSKVARNAKTKLTVRNGETAVIGGLYQTLKTKTQDRIPVLSKLPIIGFLFRSNEELTERSEIMILITPRIVPNPGGAVASTPPVSNLSGFPPAAPAAQAVPVSAPVTNPNAGALNTMATNNTQAKNGAGTPNNLDLGNGGDFGAESLNGGNPSMSLNQGNIPANNGAKKNGNLNSLNSVNAKGNTTTNAMPNGAGGNLSNIPANTAGNMSANAAGNTAANSSSGGASNQTSSTNSGESSDELPSLDNLDEDI